MKYKNPSENIGIKVSVIIPTYNADKYIKETIESVLNQTEKNLEVITSDDVSTDNTVSVIETMIKIDNRVKLIKNDKNRGPSYARNRAIEMANGQWVAILDADDFYHPDRLKNLIKIAEDSNADLVADNIYYVDEHGKNSVLSIKIKENDSEVISTIDFIKNDLPNTVGFKYGFLQPIIKKKFLVEKNIKYDENVRIGEDFMLCVECLLNGAKFILNYNAYYYYRHVQNSLINSSFAERKILSAMMDNNSKLISISEKLGNNEATAILQYRQRLIDHTKIYTEISDGLKNGQLVYPIKTVILNPMSWGYFALKAIDFFKRKFKLKN
jgi:succinoglycan biosynthesis protein ExoO